jgi:carbamoyltransferase
LGFLSPRYLLKQDTGFAGNSYAELAWCAALQHGSEGQAGLSTIRALRTEFGNRRIRLCRYPHHLCHAANACYTSPLRQASCVIVDGFGEFGALAVYRYLHPRIELIKRQRGFDSLGFAYALLTRACGFDPLQGEEWKLMGLAGYGRRDENFAKLLEPLLRVQKTRVNFASMRKIEAAMNPLQSLHAQATKPRDYADLAHTVQSLFADTMTQLLKNVGDLGLSTALILGGGCALNSSYNGQILEQTGFQDLFVPSAPADDGNALGAALLAYYQDQTTPADKPASDQNPYLGSAIPAQDIERAINVGDSFHCAHFADGLVEHIADKLAHGAIVGWAQGRAEFGPRALGNRSILADARSPEMKDRLNQCVKFREDFRPFAPAILAEYGPRYFENYQDSPYMERTLRFRSDFAGQVPAAVHVDGTGRLQTVRSEWNPLFHQLLHAFSQRSGVALILNTSFNVMGKPIVHSVEDAIAQFATTGMDVLVLGDYVLEKRVPKSE